MKQQTDHIGDTNKMVTAVEWFYDILTSENWEYKTYEEQDEIYQKAKQMEKEQIIEAFDCDGTPQPGEVWISNGELYYNETYNK